MISINKARNLVLYLLEKNNRGFISPSAFDSFCDLAQMDLFENLFYSYNKWMINQNKGNTNVEFGDIAQIYQSSIDIFSMYSTPANFVFNNTSKLWEYNGDDLYRNIGLSLVNAQGKKIDVEQVSKGYELNNLVNSKINAPTLTYPIFTEIGNGFKVYPTIPVGYSLELLYIRRPKAPKWTYIMDSKGNPIFNPGASDRQDIELDESMYSAFIIKVMEYCGVSIREVDVVQVASAEQEKLEQKKS